MIGIELTINNDEKIKAALGNGAMSVIFHRISAEKRNDNYIHFSGLDSGKNQSVEWLKQDLKKGDTFKIEIKNIESNSQPLSVKTQEAGDDLIEKKLRMYHNLKRELEEKGYM
jgi:hypothetical protein